MTQLLSAALFSLAWLSAITCVHADSPPPASVLSLFETGTQGRLNRDCGYSRQLSSSESLWLFCDSAEYPPDAGDLVFVAGTVAARGPFTPGLVPDQLIEVPTPPIPFENAAPYGAPQRFLINPTGLTRPDGRDCSGGGAFQAAWMTGVATIPSTGHLMIVYREMCVVNEPAPGTPHVRGIGIAEYDPITNAMVGDPVTLIRTTGPELPRPWDFASPIVQDGFLYLFASYCDEEYLGTCIRGSVYVAATLPAASAWSDRSTYHFYDGSAYPGWSTKAARARPILPNANAYAVTVDRYEGHGLVLIASNDIVGGHTIWRSPSGNPLGAWSAQVQPALPGCEPGEGLFFCRALIGHPELSTDTHLLYSYFSTQVAATEPKGHVQVVSVPW